MPSGRQANAGAHDGQHRPHDGIVNMTNPYDPNFAAQKARSRTGAKPTHEWRLDQLARVARMASENRRRQAHLAAEVQHHVHNTIAIIQSLAHMSFADLPNEVVTPFEERLIALAGVHKLLVRTAWEGADLREILEHAAGAFQVRSRIDIRGPAVTVAPSVAVLYGLAFHELCANAVQHGAFSREQGRVDVSWRLVDRGKFYLVWREHGGPPVSEPTRKGFGSRLLKRALAMHLGTPVDIHYLIEGLVCEFVGAVQTQPPRTIGVSAVC
jgi:two-component sensor histidine kinase